MAAAPNDWTTSSVRTNASRFRLGAISAPLSTANEQPITHAHRRTVTGLIPPRSSRSALSTTALIAAPERERLKNAYKTIVVVRATNATMI